MRLLGRIVWNNLDLKLASLAIALLLWSAVAYQPVSEAGYDVPLHLRNVPATLEPATSRLALDLGQQAARHPGLGLALPPCGTATTAAAPCAGSGC